jgi:hypothetical protein
LARRGHPEKLNLASAGHQLHYPHHHHHLQLASLLQKRMQLISHSQAAAAAAAAAVENAVVGEAADADAVVRALEMGGCVLGVGQCVMIHDVGETAAHQVAV